MALDSGALPVAGAATVARTDFNNAMTQLNNAFPLQAANIGAAAVTPVKLQYDRTPRPSQKLYGQMIPGAGPVANNGLSKEGLLSGMSAEVTHTQSNDADGRAINCATNAAGNADSGTISPGFAEVRTTWNPIARFRFKHPAAGDLLVQRTYIGLFSADPMATDTPGAGGISGIGLHYNPAVSANLRAIACDGAADNFQEFGAGIPADTADHELIISVSADGTAIAITLDGTAAVVVANLPGVNTDLGTVVEVRTLEAVAKNMKVYRIELEEDNS